MYCLMNCMSFEGSLLIVNYFQKIIILGNQLHFEISNNPFSIIPSYKQKCALYDTSIKFCRSLRQLIEN